MSSNRVSVHVHVVKKDAVEGGSGEGHMDPVSEYLLGVAARTATAAHVAEVDIEMDFNAALLQHLDTSPIRRLGGVYG